MNESLNISLSQSDLENHSTEVKTKLDSLFHPHHSKLNMRQSILTPISPLEEQLLKCEDTLTSVNKKDSVSLSLSPSSAASSILNVSRDVALSSLKSSSDPLHNYQSRRSSTMTTKYSVVDALDLEYALLKVTARDSLGAYSLSQSLQKLTFTQSLAFPELARGLSAKRNSSQSNTNTPLRPLKPGISGFAKVITVLILVLISILVFGAMYKFIGT